MAGKGSFWLVLEDGRGKSKAYTFAMNPPRNNKLLKAIIQRKFSIPTFCQEIYYESTKLKDDIDLASFHIKEYDTFHVCYDTPADIRPVLNVLKSLTEIVKHLEDEQHDGEMQPLVVWAQLCCELDVAALKQIVKVVLGSIRRQKSVHAFQYAHLSKEIMWAGFKALYK